MKKWGKSRYLWFKWWRGFFCGSTLLHRAIGEKSTCVFIDHGLLRKNEANQVMTTLKDDLGLNINMFNHKDKFLSKLKGVTEPEKA